MLVNLRSCMRSIVASFLALLYSIMASANNYGTSYRDDNFIPMVGLMLSDLMVLSSISPESL